MRTDTLRTILLVCVLSLASPPFSFADPAPTADERARIEKALRAEGFVSWREIELDDGLMGSR
jgi:hypothetical protein